MTDVQDLATDPEKLKEESRYAVETFEGDYGAYIQFDTEFNLHHIASEWLSEDVEYEPTVYPGLIYQSDLGEYTVVIFEDGNMTVLDAESPDYARVAIRSVVTTLEMARIYQLDFDADDIEVVEMET